MTASESALGGTAVHLAPADLEDRFGVFELLPFKSLFGMNLADHSSSENVADWKAWVVGLLAWSLLFRSWAGDVFGVSWSLVRSIGSEWEPPLVGDILRPLPTDRARVKKRLLARSRGKRRGKRAGLQGGVDITRPLLAGLLIMFGLIGRVMTGVRRNFWVGVRTPWTIASERVWEDTHRLAARMFVIAAVAGLVVLILPLPIPAVAITVIGLILAAALWPAIYSLIHYKQLQQRGEI